MIETIVEDAAWRDMLPDIEKLAETCYSAAAASEPSVVGEVALLMTDNSAVRDLNARFREKDAPTNVLSFPSHTDGFLGDIAIAREICQDEAQERGLEIRDYVAHLIVHGLMHLGGYDHQSDKDAEDMERREVEILARFGAKSPYEHDDVVIGEKT